MVSQLAAATGQLLFDGHLLLTVVEQVKSKHGGPRRLRQRAEKRSQVCRNICGGLYIMLVRLFPCAN